MSRIKTYSFNDPPGAVRTFSPDDGRVLFDSRYSSQILYGVGVVDIIGTDYYSFQGFGTFRAYVGDYVYLNNPLSRPPLVIAKGRLLGGATGVVGNTSYVNNGGNILASDLAVSAGSMIRSDGTSYGASDAHGFFTVAGTDRIFFANMNFDGVINWQVGEVNYTSVNYGQIRVWHAIFKNMV